MSNSAKNLANFNKSILEKPQIIIANKMDMEISKENLKEFKKKVKCDIFEVSAINGNGLDIVIESLSEMLKKISKKPLYEEEKIESHILYKFEREKPFTITKEDNTWVIRGKEVEKLLKMTKFQTDESANRFANKLRRMGIDDELRNKGAADGDSVRILDFEFEYRE